MTQKNLKIVSAYQATSDVNIEHTALVHHATMYVIWPIQFKLPLGTNVICLITNKHGYQQQSEKIEMN